MKFVLENQTDEEAPIEFRLKIDHDGDAVLQARKGILNWTNIIDINSKTGKLRRYYALTIKEIGFSVTPIGHIEVEN